MTSAKAVLSVERLVTNGLCIQAVYELLCNQANYQCLVLVDCCWHFRENMAFISDILVAGYVYCIVILSQVDLGGIM